MKKDIETQILKVIQMHFNGEDWQGYLESLSNKEEVYSEIMIIFKECENAAC